jgi:DNA-binding CsgD family transcriptional regulator
MAFFFQAMLYLHLGDLESAQEVLDEFHALQLPKTVLSEIEIALAQIRIDIACQGNPIQIIARLESLIAQANAAGLGLVQLQLQLLLALVFHAQNERSKVIASIRKAIDLARGEQIIRPFIDGGNTIRLILIDALGSRRIGIDAERFVRRVIRAFDDEHTRIQKTAKVSLEQTGAHTNPEDTLALDRWNLTHREQDVVRAILKGMSRKEIASDFCTSHNTVKTHISHIYEKIGVHSSSELLRIFAGEDFQGQKG